MHCQPLEWSNDLAEPHLEHLRFVDPSATTLIVATGSYAAGQILSAPGRADDRMREIAIVLEGAVQFESNGESVVGRAGDLLTATGNARQALSCLEATKLLFVRFGHRAIIQDD